MPIRRLVGLLMLKSLRNLSNEEVVVFWSENPYAHDFCGERERSESGKIYSLHEPEVYCMSKGKEWILSPSLAS